MRARAPQLSANPDPPRPAAALGAPSTFPSSHLSRRGPHRSLMRSFPLPLAELQPPFPAPAATGLTSRQQRPFEEAAADLTSPPWHGSRPRCCPLPVTPPSPQGPRALPQVARPQAPPLRLLCHKGPWGGRRERLAPSAAGPAAPSGRPAAPGLHLPSRYLPPPSSARYPPDARTQPRWPAPHSCARASGRPLAAALRERTKRGAARHEAGPAVLVSAEGRGAGHGTAGPGGASCSVRGGSARPCPRRPQPYVGILEVGGGESGEKTVPKKRLKSGRNETNQTGSARCGAAGAARRSARRNTSNRSGRAGRTYLSVSCDMFAPMNSLPFPGARSPRWNWTFRSVQVKVRANARRGRTRATGNSACRAPLAPLRRRGSAAPRRYGPSPLPLACGERRGERPGRARAGNFPSGVGFFH